MERDLTTGSVFKTVIFPAISVIVLFTGVIWYGKVIVSVSLAGSAVRRQ